MTRTDKTSKSNSRKRSPRPPVLHLRAKSSVSAIFGAFTVCGPILNFDATTTQKRKVTCKRCARVMASKARVKNSQRA